MLTIEAQEVELTRPQEEKMLTHKLSWGWPVVGYLSIDEPKKEQPSDGNQPPESQEVLQPV